MRAVALAYFRGDDETFRELKENANLNGYSDEIAAAYAFFFCQCVGFGGSFFESYSGGQKGKSAALTARRYASKIDALGEYCARLRSVEIENVDYAECVAKYDDPTTLFYFDPPYDCRTGARYRTGWTDGCSEKLVETLLNLKGMFVLSCYDNDVYRRLESVADKRNFNAFASASFRPTKESGARVETVYYSRVGVPCLV